MPIENIIFDLDGTLVDSLPGIEYASRCAIDFVCPPGGPLDMRQLIGPPIGDIFLRIFPDIDGNKLAALVKEFRKAYDSDGFRKTVLFDGVQETLTELGTLGIRSYLATSKPQLPTLKILDLLKIRNHFVDVVCPDSRIPSFGSKSEAMAGIIAKYGPDQGKTLSVGDTNNDKAAAINCGIRFAAAAYGYGDWEEDAAGIDFRMNSLPDLIAIVQKETQ